MSLFENPAFFGELWANDYDDGHVLDPARAVQFLAELAGGGRVLELAIGTGRVALPLAARGVNVEGVEASDKMAARLRAKPGGEQIHVTIGDMADVPVNGPFRLVYLVYNTLFNLVDAKRQAECFRNVGRVLGADGAFVIEWYVAGQGRLDRGKRVEVLEVTEDSATIEVYSCDAATQRSISQKITFSRQGIQLRPHMERYCWPSELDLMAEQAGLRLEHRYADWDRNHFDSDSRAHISVYRPV